MSLVDLMQEHSVLLEYCDCCREDSYDVLRDEVERNKLRSILVLIVIDSTSVSNDFKPLPDPVFLAHGANFVSLSQYKHIVAQSTHHRYAALVDRMLCYCLSSIVVIDSVCSTLSCAFLGFHL